jgi:crotonobetaine/carnitine-CoA ligase
MSHPETEERSGSMGNELTVYPASDRSIGKILDDKARMNGDKTFLFHEGRTVSYMELNDRSNVAGNAFRSLGVHKHDKVAIMLENCPEFLYVWFGLAKIGAWSVPVNTSLRGEGLSYIINHCDAETLVVSESCLESVDFVQKHLKAIQRIIVHTESSPPVLDTKKEAISWPEFFQGSCESPDVQVRPEDGMMIVYTAGTTGLPKGVLKPHAYAYTSGLSIAGFAKAQAHDRFYTTLPLYHINAQNVTTWSAIAADASTVLARRFSASRFWHDIRDCQVTITSFLGAMIPILLKQPEREADPENPLRMGISAGTPAEAWAAFEKRFNVKLFELYGSSEGGSLRNDEGKRGSMGKPHPSNIAKVVDEDDRELPPHQVGELVFKYVDPRVQLPVYYKMPEATAEKTRGGWLRTGDLAYRDEQGYFYFVDRQKDAIRRRGENISSYEVEKAVNSHPDVLESAAVGVPAELGEDEVKIYVVLKPDRRLTPEELIRHCEPRMARFMVPRYVEFINELPKTTTQKVAKKTLKEKGVGPMTWDREKACSWREHS